MPEIMFTAEDEFIANFLIDGAKFLDGSKIRHGTADESDRLAFDIGSVQVAIGVVATGVSALEIARAIIRASHKSKKSFLEITSPTARIRIEVKEKTEDEIKKLVEAAMPFTKEK